MPVGKQEHAWKELRTWGSKHTSDVTFKAKKEDCSLKFLAHAFHSRLW